MENDDEMSLLAKLRALQGQSQGTNAQQQGMSDAMTRIRHKINAPDPSVPAPPPSDSDNSAFNRPAGPGALTPAQKAILQQKVDTVNANINANDAAQTAAYPQGDQRDEPADYLKNKQNMGGYAQGGEVSGYGSLDDDNLKNNGMAHGGEVRFPMLRKKMKK